MSDLRSLIRELLAEEIASLRADGLGAPRIERVRVATSAELTEFALSVLRRAEDPGFVAAVEEGRLLFKPDDFPSSSPARTPSQPIAASQQALVATTAATVPQLRKNIITERDIAGIAEGEARVRIAQTARLTPLAGDEIRRRRIRIERVPL